MSNPSIEEPRSKEYVLKQFREEALTDAARKLIAQEGFQGVTVELVAELAGVSKGTIYLYFKNKDDLIRATITNTFTMVMDEVRAATQNESHFEGKLRALVTTQLQQFATNQAFFRALLSDSRYGPKPDCGEHDEVVGMHIEFARFITQIVDLGRSSGVLRSEIDASEVSFFIIHLLQSTGMRHLLGLSNTPLGAPEEVDRILDYIFNGIAIHGA